MTVSKVFDTACWNKHLWTHGFQKIYPRSTVGPFVMQRCIIHPTVDADQLRLARAGQSLAPQGETKQRPRPHGNVEVSE